MSRYSRDSSISRNATISDFGFGTSTPTAPFPGIGATIRMLCARMASARSFASVANCLTFTPGAGSISNCVTTGPVVRPTSSPSTRNVRSASMSFTPIASSSRLPRSALRGGGGVRRSGDGRSSSTPSCDERRGIDCGRDLFVMLRRELGLRFLLFSFLPGRGGLRPVARHRSSSRRR